MIRKLLLQGFLSNRDVFLKCVECDVWASTTVAPQYLN